MSERKAKTPKTMQVNSGVAKSPVFKITGVHTDVYQQG